MFAFIKAIWRAITGIFSRKTDSLYENENVMAATYDEAIAKGSNDFQTAKNAVASLIGIEQSLIAKIKQLGERIAKLNTIKQGAQVAMQRRLDLLKGQGKTKDQILVDAEFLKHKAAFEDASSTLGEVQKQFDEKEADLKSKQVRLSQWKAKLQQMQRNNNKLHEEKQEAIADIAVAKQQERVDAVFSGIPQSTTDNDLVKAREARSRVVNRAHVTAELAGNDALNAENEYLKMASTSKSNEELDSLLNWGDLPDKKKEELSPAKIPE